MKVAVVGAGLIGSERIDALKKISAATNGQIEIGAVVDPDQSRLSFIQEKYGVRVVQSLAEALQDTPDWVFVCTPHEVAKSAISQAFDSRCNVLVEKPLGRSLAEGQSIFARKPADKKLAVGFNYRFYSGIEAAIHDAQLGKFGKLISINMILGHGNSPGMEKSWKLDPIKCGGGCLIDPGVHLLDIALNLSESPLTVVGGKQWSGFWNTGIEEEAHLILSGETGTIFNLQVSLNRWRSAFRLEINGTDGYGVVEGRGRSYGPQSYRTGRRWGWQDGKSQSESETLAIDAAKVEDSFLRETAMLFGADVAKATLGSLPVLSVCNDSQALNVMALLDSCRERLGVPLSY